MRSGIEKCTAAAAVLVAASALLLPGTASAAAPQREPERDWAELHALTDHSRECVDNAYVKGCVQPYGDMLWLRDDEWDTLDVRLWWVDDSDPEDPRNGVCQDNEGYGDWTRCDKDLPDGHVIKWATSWWVDGEWRFSEYRYTTV